MFTGMLHTHKLFVTLFLLIYLIKTVLLLLNKNEALKSFISKTKIFEIVCSAGFLITGIFLAYNSGNINFFFWIKIMCVAAAIPVAVVAYKKSNKILAVISLLFIVGAYGLAEMGKNGIKTKPSEFDSVATADLGKTIYEKKCANCHGADGKLGLSGAKDLTASVLSRDEKTALIKSGKNSMMSFSGQLDDVQINAVVDFVENMKH